MTYADIYEKLMNNNKKYLLHKYQLKNAKLHWLKILATIGEYGSIFHLENLQQMYKFEPQHCHFNKTQYSLHCTVVHGENGELNYVFTYQMTKSMMVLLRGMYLRS